MGHHSGVRILFIGVEIRIWIIDSFYNKNETFKKKFNFSTESERHIFTLVSGGKKSLILFPGAGKEKR